MYSLVQTMSNPALWSADELEHIMGRYYTFVVERSGTDMEKEALAPLVSVFFSFYIEFLYFWGGGKLWDI